MSTVVVAGGIALGMGGSDAPAPAPTRAATSEGAAGSLAVILVWIYYSALIFFFGASITRSYARLFGSRMSAEDRRRQEAEEARKAGAEPAAASPAHRASPWFGES